MQRRLDKAVRDNDVDRIRHITYLLSRRSLAVRIVAIERVTRTNTGKHTAGVDGVTTPSKRKEADRFRRQLLEKVDGRKSPSPIRRIYIPKPNGKGRPLGIPTITDRVIQDLIRITIEPIAEYHFSENSYGFRPKRSCHDAIQHIFNKTSSRGCPQWILEGDIRGCFDHIDHNSILNQMAEWKIPKSIREIVRSMLKAGITSETGYQQSYEGTPQGGILSPMLANIALTTLDEWGESLVRRKSDSNPIVRYADDFIVVCKSKEEAIGRREEIKTLLDSKIGLELSDEKTRITNIHQGFNFLGFNIRKYRQKSPHSKYHQVGQLLIKPQMEKVQTFLKKGAETIREAKGRNLAFLIRQLNPKLKGFANYYRFVVSKRTLNKLTYQITEKTYRWLCKSHPNKSRRWVWKRYTTNYRNQRTITFGMYCEHLYLPTFMPITRFTKVKRGRRVYDNSPETREYWLVREYKNSLDSIYSTRVEKLFKRQRGRCPVCRKEIAGEQIRNNDLHQHHLNPKSIRDEKKLSNLRLIHKDCHVELHRILSLEEMSKLALSGIDYCEKDYLYKSFV
jgi:RNA-directed DNA polymerase